ncbi:MAG: Eco47II family restriction endonuclease [Oscillospiraceae bacterium]|nr:Eco47II family restriction endonuclease [Oscillospiraceae bacterium]
MWPLRSISEDDFTKCVTDTIISYADMNGTVYPTRLDKESLRNMDLIFDKRVEHDVWNTAVRNELIRRTGRSKSNDIGTFHRGIFRYSEKCHVPDNGRDDYWDMIIEDPDGINLPDGSNVHTVYVKMQKKHTRMNSESAINTFIMMQNQLLYDHDCACFLVEALTPKSQNIVWAAKVDGQNVGHRLIRRVSLDRFYALVTGQDDAFYQICMILPIAVQKALYDLKNVGNKHYATIESINTFAEKNDLDDEDMALIVADAMFCA